ncbi:MAG TPA: VOC family protein, partial [Acidobacteriota bacterium]
VKNDYTPDGWPAVIPRIVANEAEQLVNFIKNVFDAVGDYSSDRPAVLNIGGSLIMISDAGVRDPMPAFLYVYVADCDQTYQRAIRAGAKSLEKPAEVPYGDRRAMIQDQWGNIWQIATFKNSAGSALKD